MNDHHRLLRFWMFGNLILMITLGTFVGALLRWWHENPVLPRDHAALLATAGLMAIGLFAVWFRNGHRLWVAARAR